MKTVTLPTFDGWHIDLQANTFWKEEHGGKMQRVIPFRNERLADEMLQRIQNRVDLIVLPAAEQEYAVSNKLLLLKHLGMRIWELDNAEASTFANEVVVQGKGEEFVNFMKALPSLGKYAIDISESKFYHTLTLEGFPFDVPEAKKIGRQFLDSMDDRFAQQVGTNMAIQIVVVIGTLVFGMSKKEVFETIHTHPHLQHVHTFELEELRHYRTTYTVKANNEKEAERLLLEGEGDEAGKNFIAHYDASQIPLLNGYAVIGCYLDKNEFKDELITVSPDYGVAVELKRLLESSNLPTQTFKFYYHIQVKPISFVGDMPHAQLQYYTDSAIRNGTLAFLRTIQSCLRRAPLYTHISTGRPNDKYANPLSHSFGLYNGVWTNEYGIYFPLKELEEGDAQRLLNHHGLNAFLSTDFVLIRHCRESRDFYDLFESGEMRDWQDFTEYPEDEEE